MKKIFMGIATLAALIGSPAFAADMAVKAPPPPAPAWSWSGCYVGADVGYAWQYEKDNETNTAGVPTIYSPAGTHPDGIKGGGYGGCNWQFASPWVVGFEFDGEAANVAATGVYAPSTDFYKSDTRAEGSARVRVGYAINRSLIYVTGGLAIASIRETYQGTAVGPLTTNITDSRTGWTVGAGWEYAFTNNWIGRIEYRHSDFGTVTDGPLQFCTVCTAVNESHRTTEDAIRLGIAYKFNNLSPFTASH